MGGTVCLSMVGAGPRSWPICGNALTGEIFGRKEQRLSRYVGFRVISLWVACVLRRAQAMCDIAADRAVKLEAN